MTVLNDIQTAQKLDVKIENKYRTLASTGFREQADTRTRTCDKLQPFNEGRGYNMGKKQIEIRRLQRLMIAHVERAGLGYGYFADGEGICEKMMRSCKEEKTRERV